MPATYYDTERPSVVAILTEAEYAIDAPEAAEAFLERFPHYAGARDDLAHMIAVALRYENTEESIIARDNLALAGVHVEFWTLHRNKEQ